MADRQTLAAVQRHDQEIRKSRFVVHAAPVDSVDEALAFVARLADPAATHNCWAYRIGQQYRFNDDGEPAGTAGKPILQAIDGQGLDDVAVLVIRWFGGIKLGAGGLMRAYGGCAAQCLRAAPRLLKRDLARASCFVDYADLALLKARVQQAGAAIELESFEATGARLSLAIAQAERDALEALVNDLTRGRGQWQPYSGKNA